MNPTLLQITLLEAAMPLIAVFLVFVIGYALGTYLGMKALESQK